MKKIIVASVLGMVASVAVVSSSYGQGHIFFDNYNTAAGKTTLSGTGVDSTFHAVLFFALGSSTEPADPSGTGSPSTLAQIGSSVQYVVNGAGPGYFIGPIIDFPTYVSGPITFEILAYNGADYGSSTIRGHSVAFTMPSIASGLSPAGNFDAGLLDFQVLPVPEPSTFALLGLGTGALLFFRRRK